MAEESKVEENKSDEEQPVKKKSKKMLFIIIGVVVLGGGGAAAFFLMNGGDAPADAAAVVEEVKEEAAGLVPLDTFLVNLSDPGGKRYLKLTMRLTVAPESEAAKIGEDDLKLAKIRDRILTVLMSKQFDELANPLGKESLRVEVQGQVDALLEESSVRDVLFSEFVVQ